MRLIRKAEVLEMVGVSYPTLWRKMRKGEFPLPRRMGIADNSPVRWVSTEIQEWIDKLPSANSQLIAGAKLYETRRNVVKEGRRPKINAVKKLVAKTS